MCIPVSYLSTYQCGKCLFLLQIFKNKLRLRICWKTFFEHSWKLPEKSVSWKSLINRNLGPFFLFRLCVALIALIWALFTHETGITQHVGKRSRPPMAIKGPMTFLYVSQMPTQTAGPAVATFRNGKITLVQSTNQLFYSWPILWVEWWMMSFWPPPGTSCQISKWLILSFWVWTFYTRRTAKKTAPSGLVILKESLQYGDRKVGNRV